MTTCVLAIDLGSTGVKVAVIDAKGAVLSGAGEVIPTIFTPDGGAEQDPGVWWDAIGRCARRAIDAAGPPTPEVGLIAVTSQYTSTVAVRADCTLLANAVMWMDQRGRRHNTAVPSPADAVRWIDIHGMAPSGNDDLGHIALIKAQWPEVYAAAHALVEPMDYIAARLTGHVTATQNTMFPMLSVDNRTWGSCEYSDELLSLSGVEPDKLPALVPMGSPRGPITADAAAHLGVDAGAVVMDATIDSVTSATGTGTS